jgi:hypothetical protein
MAPQQRERVRRPGLDQDARNLPLITIEVYDGVAGSLSREHLLQTRHLCLSPLTGIQWSCRYVGSNQRPLRSRQSQMTSARPVLARAGCQSPFDRRTVDLGPSGSRRHQGAKKGRT